MEHIQQSHSPINQLMLIKRTKILHIYVKLTPPPLIDGQISNDRRFD